MTAHGRVALIALSMAFAAGVEARDLRHPASGVPAFTLQVPDDWTHKVDPDDNLILASADASTSFVFTLGNFSGDLEDAAKRILRSADAMPPTGKTAASISGLPGFAFDSSMKVGDGPQLELKLTIVRVGEKGFGSCTRIERAINSPEQRQRAEAVMRSVAVVGASR